MKARKRELATRESLHKMIQTVDRKHRQAIESEKKISVAAQHRLEAIETELGAIRGKVLIEEGMADRYQELIMERGRLQKMAGKVGQVIK